MTKLIAYYSVYNEADFLQQSLESICPHVDKTIIIEGAWKETYMVNGHMHSNDGTVKIIKKYIRDNPALNIEFYQHHEDSQLEQRNVLWRYLDETCIMLLVDGDEVWTPTELLKIHEVRKSWPTSPCLPAHVYTVNSLIFINDFYNVSEVRYPRAWEIEANVKYNFLEPNRISANGLDFNTRDLDAHYFHYSYCHSVERFKEKKKERTKLHGDFAWDLSGEIVRRPEATINPYDGNHPSQMQSHPLFGTRRHKEVAKAEVIVYVEHSGIGNLVLATPMLRALRKAKPDAHIHVVGWKRSIRILEGADFVDHVIAVDEHGLSFFNKVSIDHLLVSPVSVLDQVVQLLGTKAKKVYKLPGISPWTVHESDRKMLLAKKLGFRGPTPKPEVCLFGYNNQHAILSIPYEFPSPFICINASFLKDSHWYLKHFGDSRFAKLIDMINAKYPSLGMIFVGSDVDKGDADRIIALANTPEDVLLNACGFSDDIKDTGCMLKGARACIGNDGGLQHIADAVGTPTVTVFTFTNPVKNKPLHGKIVMVPCEKRLTCQHGNFQQCQCLEVPIDQVFTQVKDVLATVLEDK